MNKIQLLRATSEFLKRTPISGEEAETMVLCKNWLRTMEQLTEQREKEPRVGGQVGDSAPESSGDAVSQVADTSGK